MKKTFVFLMALSMVIGITMTAGATTYLVDTGTPSVSGDPAALWTVSSGMWLAGRFTIGSASDIGPMEGYITTNVAGQVDIAIYADSGGTIGAWQFTKSFQSKSSYYQGWQGTSGYSGHLNAGTYWIAFQVTDEYFGADMGTEPKNLAHPLSSVLYNFGFGWTSSDLSLPVRIEAASAVPLPGAFLLLGPGLAGLAMVRRRFKK